MEVVEKQEGEGGRAGGLMADIGRTKLEMRLDEGGCSVTIFPSHQSSLSSAIPIG